MTEVAATETKEPEAKETEPEAPPLASSRKWKSPHVVLVDLPVHKGKMLSGGVMEGSGLLNLGFLLHSEQSPGFLRPATPQDLEVLPIATFVKHPDPPGPDDPGPHEAPVQGVVGVAQELGQKPPAPSGGKRGGKGGA